MYVRNFCCHCGAVLWMVTYLNENESVMWSSSDIYKSKKKTDFPSYLIIRTNVHQSTTKGALSTALLEELVS